MGCTGIGFVKITRVDSPESRREQILKFAVNINVVYGVYGLVR